MSRHNRSLGIMLTGAWGIGKSYYTEAEVKEALSSITRRLNTPEDISFYDYGRIAVALIGIKYALGVDIDDAAKLLVKNLKGRGISIRADDLFWYSLDGYSKEEQKTLSS